MRTLGELSHIPMLSEVDAKRKADEKFQQGLDHQEAQQELISKYNVNKNGTKQFGGVPPTDNKKPPTEDKSKETQEKLEAVGVITKALIDGREVPWVLGLDEVEVLHDNGAVTEEVYRLFNPFRDRIGRFASGGHGGGGKASKITPSGGGSGAAAANLVSVTNQAKSKPGSVIKTLGTVLGIAGLGAVGLLAVAAISANASEPEINPQAKEKEAEAQQKLAELTKNWPKYDTPEQAVQSISGVMQEIGLDGVPNNPIIKIMDLPTGIGGRYNNGVLEIDQSMADGIQHGDPVSVWVLAHELAHSNQPISDTDTYGPNNEMVGDNAATFNDFMEGQNDLVTAISVSKMYGEPIGNDAAVSKSNDASKLSRSLLSIKSGVGIISGSDEETVKLGYQQQAKVWAGIASIGASKTGKTPRQFLSRAHATGAGIQIQHQILAEVFADEMKSGGFISESNGKVERKYPTMAEVRKWMANHGYADPGKAYDQMLEEAVR
jgi:hypothetical protein